MLAQAHPKCLDRHDDARERLFFFLAAVAVSASLSWKPATEQAVQQSRNVTVEARVLLEPLAQAHLHRQSDHYMAVGHLGQLLQEAVADVFGPTI